MKKPETELTLEERRERQQALDIHAVMSTENGRRFLWRVLSYCGIYRHPEGDANQIFMQLGRRQAGLYLMALLTDVDDEKVFMMMREAKLLEEEENHVREKLNEASRDDDTGDEPDYGAEDYNGGQHFI